VEGTEHREPERAGSAEKMKGHGGQEDDKGEVGRPTRREEEERV